MISEVDTLFHVWLHTKCRDRYKFQSSLFEDFVNYLVTHKQIYVIDKNFKDLFVRMRSYSLDVDRIIECVSPEVLASNFDDVFKHYENLRRSVVLLAKRIPKVIDENFDRVFDFYSRGNSDFSGLVKVVPNTIAKNFDKIFDYYVKHDFDFMNLCSYIPDTIDANFDKIFDYYVCKEYRFDRFATEIPNTIKRYRNKIREYYKRRCNTKSLFNKGKEVNYYEKGVVL